jgi:hypothetical protein
VIGGLLLFNHFSPPQQNDITPPKVWSQEDSKEMIDIINLCENKIKNQIGSLNVVDPWVAEEVTINNFNAKKKLEIILSDYAGKKTKVFDAIKLGTSKDSATTYMDCPIKDGRCSCQKNHDGYGKNASLRSRKRRTDGGGNITRPNRSRRGGGKPKRSRDGGKLKAVLRSIRNSLRRESDGIAIPKTNKRSNKQRGRRADGGDLLMVNTPVIPYNTCKVWK